MQSEAYGVIKCRLIMFWMELNWNVLSKKKKDLRVIISEECSWRSM